MVALHTEHEQSMDMGQNESVFTHSCVAAAVAWHHPNTNKQDHPTVCAIHRILPSFNHSINDRDNQEPSIRVSAQSAQVEDRRKELPSTTRMRPVNLRKAAHSLHLYSIRNGKTSTLSAPFLRHSNHPQQDLTETSLWLADWPRCGITGNRCLSMPIASPSTIQAGCRCRSPSGCCCSAT